MNVLKRKVEVKLDTKNFNPLYPNIPSTDVRAQAFVKLAEDRFLCKAILIPVLRALENAILRGADPREATFAAKIGSEYADLLFPSTEEAIQRDLESHFILRLFCCEGQHRDFFLKQEVLLCKARLAGLQRPRLMDFLAANDFTKDILELSDSEVNDNLSNLVMLEPNADRSGTKKYFKTRWTNCLSLVGKRKVFLLKGWAYLSERNLSTIITQRFRSDLSFSLARLRLALSQPTLRAEFPFYQQNIEAINEQLDTGFQGFAKGGTVTPADLPHLAKSSFPVCMSEMYNHLTTQHHLKHFGRLELQLFLKGIGLSLEGALEFWASQLKQNPSIGDKFDKEYAYGIRHAYGREGKKTDYTPFGCIKIIMTDPGPAETHGCPFKHYEAHQLMEVLQKQGISGDTLKAIAEKAKDNHFQIACQLHFKARHQGTERQNLIIMHPNEYYQESKKYYEEKLALQPPDEQ